MTLTLALAGPARAQDDAPPADPETAAELHWPRIIEEGDTTFTVYQPQIDKFDDAVLEARAAVQVETKGNDGKTRTTYGVIWIRANTAIDKDARLVALDDIQVVKANFPTAGEKADEYLDVFRRHTEGTRTISLDRIEANLAVTQADQKGNAAVPIKNDPPKIYYRTNPAVLVLIDGEPVVRPVEGSPGIDRVTVRAIDSSESPILEQDYRTLPLEIAGAIEIIGSYVHSDCSYELHCNWDLALFDADTAKFKVEPQPIEVLCHGEDYDDGFWRENGHFQVCLGFEHFFTGHARLLGSDGGTKAPAAGREEARFLEAMAWPENIERYHEKTRENIRKLLDWTQRVATAVPMERLRLWSEGEEDFEGRLEEILAVS